MIAPRMPMTMVMIMLMFCLPGRTRRARKPMTAPKMIVPMIVTGPLLSSAAKARDAGRTTRPACQDSDHSPRWTSRAGTTLCAGPAAGGCRWLPGAATCSRESERAEADAALLGGADVDVADAGDGHEDQAALVVGEAEQPTVGERLAHGLGHLLGRLVGLQRDLACDVLHADLDLHGIAFRQWCVSPRPEGGPGGRVPAKANPPEGSNLPRPRPRRPCRSWGSRPGPARTGPRPVGRLRRAGWPSAAPARSG